jgi:hypothetical protein
MLTLVLINTIIFTLIAIIHVYWAFGGPWGMHSALPTKSDGNLSFEPHPIVTLGVALGLWLFALITLGNLGLWDASLDRAYIKYGTWAITAIFALRALGDFRYVGFFKTTKNTVFAKQDTRFYTPLCVVIASISAAILLNSEF